MAAARKIVSGYPKELTTSVQPVAAFSGGGFRNAGVQMVIAGPDIKKLDEYSASMVEQMKKNPNIVDADRTLLPGKPELRVSIDRQRAADLGVRVADISQTLNIMIAGQEVTTFNEGTEQYDVVLRAQGEFRRNPESLRRMTVPSSFGWTVGLENAGKG